MTEGDRGEGVARGGPLSVCNPVGIERFSPDTVDAEVLSRSAR